MVRKLILEMVTGSFQNHPKLACGSEQLDERHQRCSNAEREPAGEFLAQRHSNGEPGTVCKVRDGTHETQPSESICLNDSEEKRVPASGCMLDTGRVEIVDVQNRQEAEVYLLADGSILIVCLSLVTNTMMCRFLVAWWQACAAGEDTIICMSNQDEKNELLIEESNNELNMRSCAPKEDEVLKGSKCAVTNKEHGESLFVSLDDNQKFSSQAEVKVQDVLVSRSRANTEIAAQVIACQEHSYQRSAEVGDGCFRPSQDMDSVMMHDASKDDDGLNPERLTAEGDCGGPHEDTGSVTLGDTNKDVDTKYEENAIIENVKEIAMIENVEDVCTTADNVSHGDLCVSSQSTEGNTDTGMTSAGNTNNGPTGVSTASPDGLVPSIDVPCSTINEIVLENISSDAQRPLPDGTCKLVDRPCSPKTFEGTSLDGKRPAPDGTNEENDIVIPGDKCPQKDNGQDTDAKIERHYKRRKVLALEKQQSFSDTTSLD